MSKLYQQIDSNKRKSALFIILYVVIIILLGLAFGLATEYGYVAVAIALAFALPTALLGYYAGDKFVLGMTGARGPISKEQNQELYRLVENLSITAGMKMTPKNSTASQTAMPSRFAHRHITPSPTRAPMAAVR